MYGKHLHFRQSYDVVWPIFTFDFVLTYLLMKIVASSILKLRLVILEF